MTMTIKLTERYRNQRVEILDTNGQTWIGTVDDLTSAADNDDTAPSLTIMKPEVGLFTDGPVELLQSEIKSIEVIANGQG